MPRIAGHIIAPPMPIRNRQVSNNPMFGASPPITEKMAKIAVPRKKMRLRPNMSANRPPVTMATPNTMAYPLITHCTVVTSVLKALSIAGSATESAVKSFATTRTATPMAIMPSIAALSRRSFVAVICSPSVRARQFRT